MDGDRQGRKQPDYGVVYRRLQAEALTSVDAAVRVAWRESGANGSVVVSGSVSAPAELTVTLAREGALGKVIARTSVSAKAAGPFTATAKLPATVVPGAFVLHVGGTSASLEIHPSLGSALPLEKGVWQAVLKAKGKIVKRAPVRIRSDALRPEASGARPARAA